MPPSKGPKNYISQGGMDRLMAEYQDLKEKQRPEILKVISWAAGNGDRSENADYIYGKKRLREIDSRLRFLGKRLKNIEVVEYIGLPTEIIRFGATVTVASSEGVEATYIIVGQDEIDTPAGKISWLSPIGKVLMGKSMADVVVVRSPRGDKEFEILNIEYKKWD
jgi:transcription elongation factor GreB